MQFVGAAALVLIALLLLVIVGGFFFVRAKLRKFATELKKVGEDLAGGEWASTPARIHLRKRDSLSWDDQGKAIEATAQFTAAGFEPAGKYEIEEMPGLRVEAFAKPAAGLYGVIYEKAPIGLWCDCVFRGADGTSMTVSNSPRGDELDHRPGHEKVYMAGQKAAALISRAEREVFGRTPGEAAGDKFEQFFEEGYANEMDWRNSRGGATEAEIRRVALKSGKDVTDDVVELAVQAKRSEAIGGLEIALREKYLASANLSAPDWEEQRKKLVFVHDQLTKDHLICLLSDFGCYADSHGAMMDGDNLRARADFRKVNDLLGTGDKFEKVGELNEPVGADVYLAPREREEE